MDMETKTATYQVPEHRLEQAKAEIAKLNKRGAKLEGVAPIELVVGEYKDVAYARSNDGYLAKLKDEDKGKDFLHIVYVRFYTVTLSGITPKLAGWSFVATLEHLATEEGSMNLLRTLPWFEGQLPEQFRTASPDNCDHCHKLIKTRKETFVVQNDDGSWKQVGRNCLVDFLGGLDPHAIVAALEMLQAAMDALSSDKEGGFGGGGESRVGLENFLGWVASNIRVDGWASRGKARESNGAITATADQVMTQLNPPEQPKEEYKKWVAERTPTQEDLDTATKALEYVRTSLKNVSEFGGRGLSDYEYNLHVVSKQTLITWKMTGLAASIIPYYLKEVERRVLREIELRRLANSEHKGTIGKPVILNVQVVRVMVVGEDSQWGSSQMHKMITDDGSMVVWFSRSDDNLKPGATYTIRGTVKKHDEYKGVKQTTLTRVWAIPEAQVDAEKAKLAPKAPRTPAQIARAEKAKATRAAKEAKQADVVNACPDCTSKKDYPWYGTPKTVSQKYNFHVEHHLADIQKVEA